MNNNLRPWVVLILCFGLAAGLWSVLGKEPTGLSPRANGSAVLPDAIRMVADHDEVPMPALESSGRNTAGVQVSRSGATHGEDHNGAIIVVVDGNHVGIAGAEVRGIGDVVVFESADLASSAGEPGIPTAVSSDDGKAILGTLSTSKHFIVTFAGLEPALATVGAGTVGETEIVLEAPSGPTIVVESSGQVVPGARILFELAGWGWPYGRGSFFEYGRTGSRGDLRVPRRAQGACGVVVAPDYCPTAFVLEQDQLTAYTIEISRAASVAGHVRGPVGDRSYYVVAEPPLGLDDRLLFASIVRNGEFALPALSAGDDWVITPCIRSDQQWQPVGKPTSVVPPADGVELWVEDYIKLRVHALDPEGNSLVPDVMISLLPKEILASGEDADIEAAGACRWASIRWPFGGRSADGARMWVAAEGFLPLPVGDLSFKPGATIDLGEVVLHPEERWKVAVVEAQTGAPIPAATVYFVPHGVLRSLQYDDPWLQEAITGEDGMATLIAHSEMSGILEARKEGWIGDKLEVAAGEHHTATLTMAKPASLTVICETFGGERVPHAPIEWKIDSEEQQGWKGAHADDEGVVRISVPPGDVAVRYAPGSLRGQSIGGTTTVIDVHHPAEGQPHQSEELEVVGLSFGEHREVSIELPVMGQLHVGVSVDGVPAPNYRVVAVPGTTLDVVNNDLWGCLDLPKGVTDATGRTVLFGVPLGKLMLVAMEPRSGLTSFMVIKADRPIKETVDIFISSAEATVLVVDANGVPIPNVHLKVVQGSIQDGVRAPDIVVMTPAGAMQRQGSPERSRIGVTNASGIAVFGSLPQDAIFEVTCTEPQSYPLLGSAVAEIVDGEVEVVLKDGDACSLELIVSGRDGLPHGDLDVVLVAQGGQNKRSLAKTDSSGRVFFAALRPGSYTLRVPSGDGADFELLSGERRSESITLR